MSDENIKKVFEWVRDNKQEMLRRFGLGLADLAEISVCCKICECKLCRGIRHQWATGILPSASAADLSCVCATCRLTIRGLQNCDGDLGNCPVKMPREALQLLGIKRNVN